MKGCVDCRERKPLDDFYHYRTGRPYTRCKACHYAYTQAWRAKNIEKVRELERTRYQGRYAQRKRDYKRFVKYGITPDEYAAMFEAQGQACAICLKPFAPASHTDLMAPVVDHDHETGKVRGILHRKCNIALEFMFDEAESHRAVEYLNRHRPAA